jgi:hypothetical protein
VSSTSSIAAKEVSVSAPDVPEGTLSAPSSKFLFRLAFPLRWWFGSTARLVADEFYRFPLRIAAVLLKQHLPRRVCTLPDFEDCTPPTFYEECTYLVESNVRTLKLLREYRWAGSLDQRIAIESFRLGAEYALCNHCIQRPNETRAAAE